MVGVCPFHDDHRPSMYVTEAKQIFKCFAWGAGGDVFKFVQMREHLTFPQAIERLAQRAGISLPERSGGADSAEDPIYAANALALRYFRECFAGPSGEAARKYWSGRGIGREITEMFQIGCAKPGWDGLIKRA